MRLKWIFGILVAVIVAIIVTFYIILSSYDFNDLKPKITKAAKEATGRELTLSGDIRLKISLIPALTVENVSFQNAAWGSRPELAKIKRFEVKVALLPLISKRIELRRLVLAEPDILIETNAAGKSNLEFEKKEVDQKLKKEGPEAGKVKLPVLGVNELQIVKGRVTYKDGRSGKTISVVLDNLTATSSGPESPIRLKLKGVYLGEPVEVEGTLGALDALISPGKPWPLNLTAKAFDTTATLDGTIRDVQAQRGIDLGFSIKGRDLANLEKVSGKLLPMKGPFDVSGKLSDPAPKTYKIANLKASFGGSGLSGVIEANLATPRPKISAVLATQKLDICSLLGDGRGAEASRSGADKTSQKPFKEEAPRDRVFPNDPLPLDILSQVDANVKFQGTQVLLPKLALSNLSVDLNLKDGTLFIKPLKAVIGGGALEVQLDLKPQGKVVALGAVIKVNQIDVGLMLKELQMTEVIEGHLDMDIDVRGQGNSVAGLMGSLGGKTVMLMGRGKIDNKYIDLLGGDLSSNLFRLLGLSRQESKYTPIHCLVSGFSIKDGRAETTALVLDTDQMSVIGDGEINLKTERLNISLNPMTKGSGGAKTTGKILAGLSELVKPFRLSGTLANPSLGIDLTQTGLAVGKMVEGFVAFSSGSLTSSLTTGGSQGKEDLCQYAVESAKKGVKISTVGKQEKKESTQPSQGSQKDIEELSKGLKKLFGK